MGRLFGTDGVRGKAGEYPLDAPTIRRLGAALVRALRHGCRAVRFLAGRDTRESGDWIERELARRHSRARAATLTSAGIIPTPAIAYLTPRMGYTAGVVISASHNPFEDNGIKVFSGAGEKFTEALERHVEVDHRRPVVDACRRRRRGRSSRSTTAPSTSRTCARSCRPTTRTQGMRIAIDCANGATTTVAPRLFQELGFDAHVHRLRARRPQHQPAAAARPRPSCWRGRSSTGGYRLGIAFDGDGDRAIFVDAAGQDRRRRRRDADVRQADEGAKAA